MRGINSLGFPADCVSAWTELSQMRIGCGYTRMLVYVIWRWEIGSSTYIYLNTDHLAGVAENKPKYGMNFEARWLDEESVEEIVKTARQKAIHRGLCPTTKDEIYWAHRGRVVSQLRQDDRNTSYSQQFVLARR